LNLIYLPLYLGGIAGPAIGANVVVAGLRPVFFVAASVLVVSMVTAIAFARRSGADGSRLPSASPRTS
jgi:hypothetical protein